MFDGCIVECEDDIDCELVRRHVVQKTGFVLNFDIKPFVTHIKIPTNLPPIDDKADGNNATLVTRLDFAELLWSRNKDVLEKVKLDGMSQTFYRFTAGVWSEISRNEVNKLFIEAVQNCDEKMGEKACRLWNNFDKIVNLVVNLHCVEDGFSDKLDTSLDIFPFKNCCYDFAIKAFRDIRMGDYVSHTTGYDYTPGQSKDGVRGFLEQVFPVEVERRAFIAIGRYIVTPREDRKIMPVLTDATDGWNAKTELMKLLNKMVGKLAIQGESAKKMMIKDFTNNKNGHDACMEKLNGKFLISADEMSGSLQLATHTLKELTSFPMVTGRRFGMSSTFEFRCKALPLFSFNKGQMPMMGHDSVFYDRMLFFHHRSKFIPAATDEEFKKKAKGYEYPFRVDPLIGQKLQGWLSAMFDLFVEAGEECMSILNDPPESLIDFRAELTQDDNPMTEFFDAHFEITRNEDDYVQVGEINVYIGKLDDKAVRGLPGSIRFRKNCFETYLKTRGIRVVSRTWVDGEHKRNVARGVKFKADDCPFIEEPRSAKKEEERVRTVLAKRGFDFKSEHHVDFSCIDNGTFCRIDVLLQLNGGVIMLEIDEDQHKFGDYTVGCDMRRMAKVMETLALEGNTLPIYWLRYNPGAYSEDGAKRKRLKALREQMLAKHIESVKFDRSFWVHYMFYDGRLDPKANKARRAKPEPTRPCPAPKAPLDRPDPPDRQELTRPCPAPPDRPDCPDSPDRPELTPPCPALKAPPGRPDPPDRPELTLPCPGPPDRPDRPAPKVRPEPTLPCPAPKVRLGLAVQKEIKGTPETRRQWANTPR
eukprot:jgi/Tetstr1/465469/TSEL_010153.t1